MHLQDICLLEMAQKVNSTPRNKDLMGLQCFSDEIKESQMTGEISPNKSLNIEVCNKNQHKFIEDLKDSSTDGQSEANKLLNYKWDELSYNEKQTVDVAQKGIIRGIRRFFSKLFLSQNKVILNKRIKNVYYKDALRSMNKLVGKLFPDYADKRSLSEFMIRFCSLKLK